MASTSPLKKGMICIGLVAEQARGKRNGMERRKKAAPFFLLSPRRESRRARDIASSKRREKGGKKEKGAELLLSSSRPKESETCQQLYLSAGFKEKSEEGERGSSSFLIPEGEKADSKRPRIAGLFPGGREVEGGGRGRQTRYLPSFRAKEGGKAGLAVDKQRKGGSFRSVLRGEGASVLRKKGERRENASRYLLLPRGWEEKGKVPCIFAKWHREGERKKGGEGKGLVAD